MTAIKNLGISTVHVVNAFSGLEIMDKVAQVVRNVFGIMMAAGKNFTGEAKIVVSGLLRTLAAVHALHWLMRVWNSGSLVFAAYERNEDGSIQRRNGEKVEVSLKERAFRVVGFGSDLVDATVNGEAAGLGNEIASTCAPFRMIGGVCCLITLWYRKITCAYLPKIVGSFKARALAKEAVQGDAKYTKIEAARTRILGKLQANKTLSATDKVVLDALKQLLPKPTAAQEQVAGLDTADKADLEVKRRINILHLEQPLPPVAREEGAKAIRQEANRAISQSLLETISAIGKGCMAILGNVFMFVALAAPITGLLMNSIGLISNTTSLVAGLIKEHAAGKAADKKYYAKLAKARVRAA